MRTFFEEEYRDAYYIYLNILQMSGMTKEEIKAFDKKEIKVKKEAKVNDVNLKGKC